MLAAGLGTRCVLSHLTFLTLLKKLVLFYFHLEMRKVKHKYIKHLVQSPQLSRWWNRVTRPGTPTERPSSEIEARDTLPLPKEPSQRVA